MNDTIFNGGENPTPPVTPPVTPAQPVVPPELAEIVGTGKKYATVEDALKSVPHAQNHIKTLEEEAKRLREELAARKTVEDLLEAAKQSGTTPPVEPTAPVGITPDALVQIVDKTLSAREAQKSAQANVETVKSAFVTQYGDKAEEVYLALARDSGLSVSALNQLSATSPTALLKLAGLNKAPAPVAKTTSSVNSEAFRTNTPPVEQTSRVKPGASTKDLVAAWRVAGQLVGKPQT